MPKDISLLRHNFTDDCKRQKLVVENRHSYPELPSRPRDSPRLYPRPCRFLSLQTNGKGQHRQPPDPANAGSLIQSCIDMLCDSFAARTANCSRLQMTVRRNEWKEDDEIGRVFDTLVGTTSPTKPSRRHQCIAQA